jgi:hypothetical protein
MEARRFYRIKPQGRAKSLHRRLNRRQLAAAGKIHHHEANGGEAVNKDGHGQKLGLKTFSAFDYRGQPFAGCCRDAGKLVTPRD